MIDEAHLIAMIREVVREELAGITMATISSNESEKRSTFKRFPSDAANAKARSIQPFGLSSRSPKNTQCLVAPVNNDPSHINVIGHFDEAKPSCEDGETVLYGADGQVIYFKNGGEIHQGGKAADEPVVLGNVMKTLMKNILEAFLNSPQIGQSPTGPVFLDPAVRSILSTELSVRVNAPATNIVGQKNFVQRT